MRNSIAVLYALALLAVGADGVAQTAPSGLQRFLDHLTQHVVTPGEWVTANPDYTPEGLQPKEYVVQMSLGADRHHAHGTLSGINADGSRHVFWTLLMLYNPVSDKIVYQQVSWQGAYMHGEMAVPEGDHEILDTVLYLPDGSQQRMRHETRFINDDLRHTQVHRWDESSAEWRPARAWEWRRRAVQ